MQALVENYSRYEAAQRDYESLLAHSHVQDARFCNDLAERHSYAYEDRSILLFQGIHTSKLAVAPIVENADRHFNFRSESICSVKLD